MPKKPRVTPNSWALVLHILKRLMLSFGTTFGQNITTTHYKLRTLQIGLNVEELGDSVVRGNPSVLEMSAYLTAVDYYNEQNAKHTRLLMPMDGFGDFPGLVTKKKS